MSLSLKAFESLESHWAVNAISPENLKRVNELVHERLAQRTVGKQIKFDFAENESDEALLKRVALAYELAAIEGLDDLCRPSNGNDALRSQAMAASSHAFDIRRLLPVPEETHDRLFFILQLSALSYCGDRWSDLRRWYRENERKVSGSKRRRCFLGSAPSLQVVSLLDPDV